MKRSVENIMQAGKLASAVLFLPLLWLPVHTEETSKAHSPRVNYDEWTPLGRGDPLKNDPTYDYKPPFSDDVYYWMHPLSRISLNSKSSQQHSKSSLQQQKGSGNADANKKENHYREPVADSRKDILDTFMKFIDGPKFPLNDGHKFPSNIRQTARPVSPTRNQYISHHYKPHRSPGKPSDYRTSVSVPEEQIIKHLSSSVHQTRVPEEQVIKHLSSSVHQSRLPEEQIVKHLSSSVHQTRLPEDQVIKHLSASSVYQMRPPYTVLMPPPMSSSDMFSKPQSPKPTPIVYKQNFTLQQADDNNIYLTQDTEKPQPSYRPSPVTEKLRLSPSTERLQTKVQFPAETNVQFPSETKVQFPTTSQKIRDSAKPLITKPFVRITTPSSVSPVTRRNPTTRLPFLHSLLQDERVSTVTTTATPSTTVTLTTDPMFAHYKQPTEPLKGPMYLIIQGHSKVQTYGANKSSYHGIPIQENEI